MVAENKLGQHEADTLLAMEKHRASDRVLTFSSLGQRENIELLSTDKREKFSLDLYRGRRNLSKVSLQNRARQTVSLRRLDVNGRKHTNPNGQVVPTPHLHVYREGFGASWAEPAPLDIFSNLNDVWTTLQDFMRYCNISKPPIIRRDLFT